MENGIFSEIEARSETVIQYLMTLLASGKSLSVGCSFGKDSSACLVLALEAIKRTVESGISCPTCYVSHGNTEFENPQLDIYCGLMLNQLNDFIESNNLPVDVIEAFPSLTGNWAYKTLGRGMLPVFADHGRRTCSEDMKRKPIERALKRIMEATQNPAALVNLVGTRYSESTDRKQRMLKRGHGPQALVQDGAGYHTLAMIADWELDEVWMLLMACNVDRGGIYSTFTPGFERTLELYIDANEGTCAVVTGDDGPKSPCNSRFGCWNCTPSGERDKSMESMIRADSARYDYLQPLNDLRNFLVNTRRNWNMRCWIGREVSPAGYVSIQPNIYSINTRRDLLRYLLSIDIREEERAEEHSAKIARGEIPNTAANRLLNEPQFNFLPPRLLVAIDFLWSIDRGCHHAFSAIKEWYEIRTLGKRYDVPHTPPYTELPQPPKKRWFRVDDFSASAGVDGLRDTCAEAQGFNGTITRPYRLITDANGSRRMCDFLEADRMEVDPVEALLMLDDSDSEFLADLVKAGQESSPATGAAFWLRKGIVRPRKGGAAVYDQMARVAQYWDRLRDQTGDLVGHMLESSISDQDHQQLLVEPVPVDLLHSFSTETTPQADLFG